jgi:two-component system CheB/CheR fusion protein
MRSTRPGRAFIRKTYCADVAPEQMGRFFTKDEHGCRVTNEIREMVVFAPQSLIMDPPFTKLDILSCRNLLIYLAPEMQKKLIPLFHYSLTPGGILLLGSAETVGTSPTCLHPLNNKLRIFRRTIPPRGRSRLSFPRPLLPAARRDRRRARKTKPPIQPPVGGGSVGAGTLRAAGGARE